MKFPETVAIMLILLALCGIFFVFAKACFNDAQRAWDRGKKFDAVFNVLLSVGFAALVVGCFMGAEILLAPLFQAAKPC